MLGVPRHPDAPYRRQARNEGNESLQSPRPRFRAKILPVILAASLGFWFAGFFAVRDVARAQPASHAMHRAQPPSPNPPGSSSSGNLSAKTF